MYATGQRYFKQGIVTLCMHRRYLQRGLTQDFSWPSPPRWAGGRGWHACLCVCVCVHLCVHTPAAHQPSPLTLMAVEPLKMAEVISGLGQLDCKWYAAKFTAPFLFIAGLKMWVWVGRLRRRPPIFPNFQTWMTPGTFDPFTRINKYFQRREEARPQPTLHNCSVLYEALRGACQSLFLNSLMIYLMPLDI